ncbi:MAG: efflux RND transporter periplasmic adaptor subunit [Cyclobacteriaceae bacterium]
MNIVKQSIFAALLLIGSMISNACSSNKSKPGAANKTNGLSSINVNAVVVKPISLDDQIIANGSIMANEEVELKSEATGRIIKINFNEGSIVQKGQLLVKIEDDELQAQLKQLKLDLEIAEKDKFRKEELIKIKGISQEELDESILRTGNLESQIDLIKSRIDKTTIIAPFRGQIGLRFASEGAYMAPGTNIAQLVQNDPVKIDFTVPERYAGLIKNGQTIEFQTSGRSKKYTGKIYAIEPRIDQATRTMRIRAKSPNPNGELVPGSFASVIISLDRIENALMVPTQVVVPRREGQDIFVYKNGKAVKIPVETGTRLESTIHISDGLAPGDTVISTGLLVIRDQMPVNIVQFDEVTEN